MHILSPKICNQCLWV